MVGEGLRRSKKGKVEEGKTREGVRRMEKWDRMRKVLEGGMLGKGE